MLSGKRWVTASLAEPETIADVTSTESQRFRPSTLAKPIDTPRSKNTCSDNILFTNESHDEHARMLISRTCGTSPTRIDNWHVAPEKWHHKQKPKATNATCVSTWRSGRDHHIRDLRSHLVRPFGPHAIRDQDKRNVHDVKSRAACLSQELAAEISRGAWARIRLISSTQTSPAKTKQFCVPLLTSEWRSDSALALPHACGRPKRSQITFRRSFPLRTSTLRNVRLSRTGAVPRVSSRSCASQSNTWCAAAFRAAATKASSSKCEPSIPPRTCRHISLCRDMSKAEVPSSFHARTPLFCAMTYRRGLVIKRAKNLTKSPHQMV